MTTPQTFRKKPVTITAVEWDGTTDRATEIIDWILAAGGSATYRCDRPGGCPGTDDAHNLLIRTLEGDMLASPGDWIIRGVAGEHYPCRPDIFAETYEPADTEPTTSAPDAADPEVRIP